jgi:hypothetical protein
VAVNILTVRVLSDGEVLAVRQEPFLVLEEGEDREQGARQLRALAEELEEQAADLERARYDNQHRRHHWWMP